VIAPPRKVRIVDVDSFQGLYIDGVLVYENHTIGVRDLMICLRDNGLIGFDFERLTASDKDETEVIMFGGFPRYIEELKHTVKGK